MRARIIILSLVLLLIAFMIIIPMSGKSQESTEITDISIEGSCRSFTVTIAASGLGEGCWDVKLDAPGKVYNEVWKRWQSSFLYIDKALCFPASEASVMLDIESPLRKIQATARLRQGSKTVERDFTIIRSCPQPLPDYWVIIVEIIIILIFGYALVWWWKQQRP